MTGEPQTIIGHALKLRADRLAREALAGVHTVEDLADVQHLAMFESIDRQFERIPTTDPNQ